VLDRGRVHPHAEHTLGGRFSGSRVDVTRRKSAELELEYLADHDTLTGLFNRRGVDLSLLHSHAQCLRTNTPHCVAILDLDHFKRINDQHGHKTGDQVLKTVAERLRSNAREADWIGRWGGEEFVVFLHGATERQALQAVERLRLAVAAQPITCDGLELHITLSAGLAAYRLHEDQPDRVMVRADRALYRAKHAGRNRSCIDGVKD
jgi:diguanylate cyclase (GGDEF)-like protein